MKALKMIGIGVGVIVLLLVVYIMAFVPAKGHVEKSIVINAPASAVFAHLNDLKKFVAWSPWSKMDPEAKNSYEGAEAGVGAKMSWDGIETGKGSQWIEESVENELVKTGLAFEGMEGILSAEFKLTPEANGTKVTWTFDGDNVGFKGKAIWMMMGGMLAGQYESGLQDLKKVVESTPIETKATTNTSPDSTRVK